MNSLRQVVSAATRGRLARIHARLASLSQNHPGRGFAPAQAPSCVTPAVLRLPHESFSTSAAAEGIASSRNNVLTSEFAVAHTVADVLNQRQPIGRAQAIEASALALHAARRMLHSYFSSLMVVDENSNRVVGMVTERDILRRFFLQDTPSSQFSSRASDPFVIKASLTVRDAMIPSNRLVCVTPQDSVRDAMRIMLRLGVRNLPVVSEGVVLGILNARELMENPIGTFSATPDQENTSSKGFFMKEILPRQGLALNARLPRLENVLPLYLESGFHSIPHPAKAASGGEDANALYTIIKPLDPAAELLQLDDGSFVRPSRRDPWFAFRYAQCLPLHRCLVLISFLFARIFVI